MVRGRGAGAEAVGGKGISVEVREPTLVWLPPPPSILSTLAWVLALAVLDDLWALRE